MLSGGEYLSAAMHIVFHVHLDKQGLIEECQKSFLNFLHIYKRELYSSLDKLRACRVSTGLSQLPVVIAFKVLFFFNSKLLQCK